jgi:hypothetical protein
MFTRQLANHYTKTFVGKRRNFIVAVYQTDFNFLSYNDVLSYNDKSLLNPDRDKFQTLFRPIKKSLRPEKKLFLDR